MKRIFLLTLLTIIVSCSKDQEQEIIVQTLKPKIEVKKGDEVLGDISKDQKIVLDYNQEYRIDITFEQEVTLEKGEFLKVKEKTPKHYFADFYGRNREVISEKVIFRKEGYHDYILEITQNELIEKFQLSETSVALDMEEKKSVQILSGNDDYKITQTDQSKAIAKVEYSKGTFVITPQPKSEGKTTSADILDVKSGETQTLSIEIYAAPSIPKKSYELSKDKKTMIRWSEYEVEEIDMEGDRILKNVTKIGEECFGYVEMKKLILPKGLTEIAGRAFSGCSELTSLTIPSGVRFTGTKVFEGCEALTEVKFESTTPPSVIGSQLFEGADNLKTIYVPMEAVDKYKSSSRWSRYKDKIRGY